MSDKGIAGHFVMGDGLQQGTPRYITIENDGFHVTPYGQKVFQEMAKEAQSVDLRQFIAEEIARQLPGAIYKVLEDDAREIATNRAFQPVDTHEHRRIEMTEESGKQWRGVLYRVEDEHATDPMVPAVCVPGGICWACGGHGESAEMMWSGAHLIHATPECVHGAQIKPEIREHRG